MSKVWLITGCSSGFGHEIALAALGRGDQVVATARDPVKLEDLRAQGAVTIALDVLSSDESLQKIVSEVLKIVGHIDILVNNAGYILVGGVEECSASEIRDLFSTNVFGQISVIRAVLPHMRAQRSGVVANFGSIGGWTGTAAAGLYCASKSAIASFSESLRLEVRHLGIDVTVIEPGYFRTNFLNGSHRITAKQKIEDLDVVTNPRHSTLEAYNGNQPGDPVKGANIIVEALTQSGRCKGRVLPPRLALGKDAVQHITKVMDTNRKHLEEWTDLVSTTDVKK